MGSEMCIRDRPYERIDLLYQEIITAAGQEDRMEVVKVLKAMVPEFISRNSEFEMLDVAK